MSFRFLNKDSLTHILFPKLRSKLHKSIDAGLETLLDYRRLAMLCSAIRATRDIKGDAIEFGTFRGGSAGVILQNLSKEKFLHICDSFAGMPEVASQDNYHQKGDFAETDEERVFRGLSNLGKNFRMHVGFFEETLPLLASDANQRYSFVHVDADLYESILTALNHCVPRMDDGSVIIFDDYGSPTCIGAKMAVDEFFSERPETVVGLTGPQYATVIGGGNARELLFSHLPLGFRISALSNSLFRPDSVVEIDG
ncbi:MAG: class I SAM-dependent methyltransferase [Acidobacteria bacterium]|nr:class I SAM-dependent methyltransferase [Acidobacteriota bacterium]